MEEDKKRVAEELILGCTHTKVREVRKWRRTRRGWLISVSLAGLIPR